MNEVRTAVDKIGSEAEGHQQLVDRYTNYSKQNIHGAANYKQAAFP